MNLENLNGKWRVSDNLSVVWLHHNLRVYSCCP